MLERAIRSGLAVALLGLAAGCAPAPAEPPKASVAAASVPAGDVYRGSAVAQQVCVQCHDVGIAGMPAQTQVNAPDFVVTANRGGMTAEQLRAWMRSTHRIMPTFMFSDAVTADLAAYIMSLRDPE
jgi:mono/diheme cytochrome c family protein